LREPGAAARSGRIYEKRRVHIAGKASECALAVAAGDIDVGKVPSGGAADCISPRRVGVFNVRKEWVQVTLGWTPCLKCQDSSSRALLESSLKSSLLPRS